MDFHELANKRRTTRKLERLSRCECCNYPISQRHHLLEIADWGESDYSVQLCANCHELYHLLYNTYILKTPKSKLVVGTFIQRVGFNDSRIVYLRNLIDKAEQLKIEISQKVARMVMDDSH